MATKTANHSKTNADRLFGAVANAENGHSVAGLMLLDPHRIETAAQPRTQFDDTSLSELANSISERREKLEGVEGTGILQPLLVSSPQTGTYRLIAGERRLRAARKLNLPFVPAVIVPDNPRERLVSQLVENLQRANLNPLEEGHALTAWMRENKVSVREAAVALGKDKNYISNRIRLTKMGEDVQQMVSTRADALIHAQLIEGVSDPKRRQQLIASVTKKGISVAELRELISLPQQQTSAINEVEVSLHRDRARGNATISALGEDKRNGDAKVSLHRDSEAEEAAISHSEHKDGEGSAEVSLCRDTSAPDSNTPHRIALRRVSLRRDTSAPPSFIEQMNELTVIGALLDSFGNLSALPPDQKTALRGTLAVLSHKLGELEQMVS